MIPRSTSARWISIASVVVVCSLGPVSSDAADSVEQTIAKQLREEEYTEDTPGCFRFAEVDLDGRPPAEILVLLLEPQWCGTGGCTAVVYRRLAEGLQEVGSIPLVDDLSVSASVTNGWRDLYVNNREGSWLLRFDGKSYPENPTVAPATRARIPRDARKVTWRRSSRCR